ncbi:hypothetical protein NC651_004662 [Populus alba x Populus x berolinensis]|nr:hypothetical protein NC651_004662 [Populus alba x Populus x berolinensis]
MCDFAASLLNMVAMTGNKWTLNTLSGKCFTCAPHRKLCNYQHTKFHKQTKNQWARDDPAFVVISSLLLAVAALLIVLRMTTVLDMLLYAFDVHCNSFFPIYTLFPVTLLVAHGFIPVLLSNLLFMVAASYYHYLNFLGYYVLPFLERTTFFLYPIGLVIVLSPICKYLSAISQWTLVSGCFVSQPRSSFNIAVILSGFNPSRYLMNVYFSQRIPFHDVNCMRLLHPPSV